MDYESFLASKRQSIPDAGIDVPPADLNPLLFGWQKDIVSWALRRGRAAIFADCGLGKTVQQLSWAQQICTYTSGSVIIFAPLAVARQTAQEGEKFGIPVTVCRTQADVQPGINVTNYEMLQHFEPDAFAGIVLDESSILKSFDGATRGALIDFAATIDFRLACTATPAPNDQIEMINHAEFLGLMSGKEIIALYFTQDGNTTHKWRLKGHAKAGYWKWLASWAVALRKPSDLGYSDDGFVLPPMEPHQLTVGGAVPDGMMFAVEAQTLDEQRRMKRSTLPDRVATCAELVNRTPGAWIVWCELNTEADALRKAIPGAREVRGADTLEYKEQAIADFTAGRVRVLISKPSMFGHGLNLQHCHQMCFVGLSHSWEQYYQATRRCWRFGQTEAVQVYQIVSENEGAVLANLERKEQQASQMMDELVKNMAALHTGRAAGREVMDYAPVVEHGHDWTLYLGDSITETRHIADESVGLTVFSPPFPGMYTYTNSMRDVGNVQNIDEMIDHFKFLIPELLRVTMPGRICAIHLSQLIAMKNRDGYIGIKDYRGPTIAAMIAGGWIYHGEVTVDKNPQMHAVRSKERGLLFKSLATDSSVMRMALADYLIYFRKPGDNPHPIRAGISQKYNNPDGWITEQEWVEWAAPVWYRHMAYDGHMAVEQPSYPALFAKAKHIRTNNDGSIEQLNGIAETDVLNVRQAKETNDERHLCPLQRCFIERVIKLWSNPGDLVFSPFAGIGSEGFEAIRWNRRFVGIELKKSYWQSAINNLKHAVFEKPQPTLFDLLDAEPDEQPALTEVGA